MRSENELLSGCVVCGPGSSTPYKIAEHMFGTLEPHDYNLCAKCGSLQIASVPSDLPRYYDTEDYYSFQDGPDRAARVAALPMGPRLMRLNTSIFLRTGIGRGPAWTKHGRFRLDHEILDIGCGSGANLRKLRSYGYTALTGADPFVADEHEDEQVHILKRYHTELTGEFDHVMLHHAFEHVADPRALLRSVRRLLKPDGTVVIRMPVMGTAAWREYGTDWVQLDAPRHLVLYTEAGFRSLAHQEGFELQVVEYDSWAFQFWGSELIRSGAAFAEGPDRFSARELQNWERTAQDLNRRSDGDSACYVLRRASSG